MAIDVSLRREKGYNAHISVVNERGSSSIAEKYTSGRTQKEKVDQRRSKGDSQFHGKPKSIARGFLPMGHIPAFLRYSDML